MITEQDRADLVALRRTIHRAPELSFCEHQTAGLVEATLQADGFTVQRWAGTGVVCILDSGRPGRTLLLRADTDALPIQEANTHDYASQSAGCMHACGHDGHTAIMLVTARLLKRRLDQLQGRIVFCFQPAEEIGAGADRMIEEGLLDKYQPDACGGLHLWSEAPTGQALITDGPFMASMDRFAIRLVGKGGHGAIPQSSHDPIVAAAQLVVALQTVVSRNTDPLEAAVVTVGRIAGGNAFNVIPDAVQLEGTVRTFSEAVQDQTEAAIRRVAQGIASAMQVSVEIEYQRISTPVINDPTYCDILRAVATEVPGVALGPPAYRTMGGEDMASFLRLVPGAFFFLGAGNAAVGAAYPHHHPNFELDEAALPLGVQILAKYAEAVLS